MNGAALRSAATVVALSIQEGIRRRVFLAVLVLTLAFLALYGLGAHFAFKDVDEFAAGEPKILDPTPLPARRCSAWRCSRRSSSARCWRSS